MHMRAHLLLTCPNGLQFALPTLSHNPFQHQHQPSTPGTLPPYLSDCPNQHHLSQRQHDPEVLSPLASTSAQASYDAQQFDASTNPNFQVPLHQCPQTVSTPTPPVPPRGTPSLYPGRLYAIANANCLQRVHQPSRIGEHSPYPSKCSLAISNTNICVQLPAVSRAATNHPSPRTSIPLLLLAPRTLFIHLSIPVLLSVWPFFTVP